MSDSPIRRLSTSSPSQLKREENLINAYEAEEERIINILSRKLEQLREEKINLENALEAESESHVNRLNRELTALRLAQQQQQAAGSASISPDVRTGTSTFLNGFDPTAPSAEVLLEAMRRENEQLRNRLVDTERDYVRIARLNEIYREELLEHRRRLGLSVDNLVGLSSADPFSQSTHRRSLSNLSPSNTSVALTASPRLSHGVPIPRPSPVHHRPLNHPSETTTPLSHSPSSTESPFVFSPTVTNPASYMSNGTHSTTPPSSASLTSNPPPPYPTPNPHALTYPSVPPPSLSSSYGSPVISYVSNTSSPVESLRPNGRLGSDRRTVESGMLRNGLSRRASVDRGARIAETGTLVPRSRAGSQNFGAIRAPFASATPFFFFSMSYQFTGYSSMPTTPQTPFQWDGGDASHLEQQQQQQQPQQPADAYTTPSPSTIQIQEFVPAVPSQDSRRRHDHEEQFLHHGPSTSGVSARHPQQMRPHIQVDTRQMRVGTSTTPPSGPPSAGIYQGAGPIRARASPSVVDTRMAAHPYRRPQSAGTGAVRPRREHEDVQSVRSHSHVSTASMPAPTTAPTRLPAYPGTVSATTSLISPAHAVSVPPENRKFIIRTDVHYDSEMRLLSASLELPGLKKNDISIVLSTCYYNGVKQVVVSGRSRPVFPSKGYAVRERKYGEFTRTLVLASDTKPEDVIAEMQDGILTIKITLPPFPEEEPLEHEISVQ
ncbi:hypothetical protein EDD17DRAFT_1884154 [Pisolithus thermaeus]|nr:hypothetical protein EDD17DRAFT_1884154 [Pisolithus thermaeus]